MAIRTQVPKAVGPLRNKVSVNLSDEEKDALARIGTRLYVSDAGALRICTLLAMRELGEVVTAHSFMEAVSTVRCGGSLRDDEGGAI